MYGRTKFVSTIAALNRTHQAEEAFATPDTQLAKGGTQDSDCLTVGY
jgi:hypothetical protein